MFVMAFIKRLVKWKEPFQLKVFANYGAYVTARVFGVALYLEPRDPVQRFVALQKLSFVSFGVDRHVRYVVDVMLSSQHVEVVALDPFHVSPLGAKLPEVGGYAVQPFH